jgi:glycosyltransferase involved in cell wall biosynthesis
MVPILNISKKSRNIGISDTVQFLGSVPHENIWKLYEDADFIVHIPLDEPFGLVPIEAALSKKPSIVSDHGGPSEIVANGITGLHVDALNPDDIAEKMDSLIKQPEYARKMGEAAYSRALKNMTWDIFMNKFENYLFQTVSR